MKNINDDVFGEMQINHENLIKEERFSFWGLKRTLEVNVEFGYNNEEVSITNEQKNSYKDFKDNLEKHTDLFLKRIPSYICHELAFEHEMDIILEKTNEYLSLKGKNIELNKENIEEKILELFYDQDLFLIDELLDPRGLLFKSNGDYGLLCECEWDIENGLVIYYKDSKLYIDVQSVFI